MATPALSSFRLGVVGVGALGSEVCRLLMARDQRDVLLIDPDIVAPDNLALSRMFAQAGTSAIGQPKVKVLRDFTGKAGLEWESFQGEIADVGLQQLRKIKVLLSCTDSALARVETTFAARALALPVLDAGVQSNGILEGRVTWFAPQPDAACYLCGLPEARRAELLAFAQAASLGCALPTEISMTGSVSTVEATAAAVLRLLDEVSLAQPATSFARRVRPGQPEQQLNLTRSVDCPAHSFGSLQALPYDEPVCTMLAPGEVLDLPWPICLDARCRSCGHRFAPRQRTALIRRRTPCPACHEVRSLDPLESLATLTVSSPHATQTLRELGLPPKHLYHLRSAILLEGKRPPANR